MDASQRRELTQEMGRASGSYELVVSPVLLALIGLGIDRWLGTTPWFTVSFAVLGFIGVCVKLYYTYAAEMEQHEVGKPWAKHS